MAGKRAEPPDPEALEREQEDERTGPVKIARHVKDDGRALIVYTRDADAPA
ncbi:MAG TPA: hypothetical protein VK790_04285 [Solirubrobacteraceae bacterium]|jgi:hypothetical protein|nr:hypothetical protein [Solirubrobacteraceae bacterium]